MLFNIPFSVFSSSLFAFCLNYLSLFIGTWNNAIASIHYTELDFGYDLCAFLIYIQFSFFYILRNVFTHNMICEHSFQSYSLVVSDINYYLKPFNFIKQLKKKNQFVCFETRCVFQYIHPVIIPVLAPFRLMVVLKCLVYALHSIQCW